MGIIDPRLCASGKQDFKLFCVYAVLKMEDSPPSRVEPVHMAILMQADALTTMWEQDQATMDCF